GKGARTDHGERRPVPFEAPEALGGILAGGAEDLDRAARDGIRSGLNPCMVGRAHRHRGNRPPGIRGRERAVCEIVGGSAPHEEEYSLETMVALLLAATASRFPEPDSHARSALSRSTGPTLVVAIATKFPHVVPSQIQAFTWVFVKSLPINPIWLLPLLEAS